MPIARSKVTAQGKISVPVEVRRRPGVGPGSIIEWHEEGREIVVRGSGRYDWDDIHHAAFPDRPPKPRTLAELNLAIRRYVAQRQARR